MHLIPFADHITCSLQTSEAGKRSLSGLALPNLSRHIELEFLLGQASL